MNRNCICKKIKKTSGKFLTEFDKSVGPGNSVDSLSILGMKFLGDIFEITVGQTLAPIFFAQYQVANFILDQVAATSKLFVQCNTCRIVE